jgi:D-3-phosphoglycerate dehydrogenase
MSPETAAQMGVTLVSLDDLYRQADFITVHTPLTKETKGMVNTQAFAKMKKGVFIINCARGGIVSEKDLHQALLSGQVAGAALDVFEEEPTQNRELLTLENVICTPHLGAATDEAQINVAIAVAEQIVAYLTTGEIKNAVNFPSVSADVLCVIQPYLSLAEKLGRFHSQVVTGGIQEVTIEYSGEILQYNLAPFTLSLLKGLLTPILDQAVNYINAPLIAKERGIKVIEVKSTEVKDYTSMISLTVKTTQEVGSTAGTIFGRRDPRIVGVNRFVLDVIPEGHMILLYNDDKPGVIGNIGTTLGNRGVNIARLHLSRDQVDGKALVVISTDGTLSDDIMDSLCHVPHVISARYIEM